MAEGGPTGVPPFTPSRPNARTEVFSRRNIVAAAAVVVVIAAILVLVRYHKGSDRRQYESLLKTSLDRIVTAQEGYFYDSTRYVASLRALPTVQLPPGVHVALYNPDRRSWWGIATHDRLPSHHCVVWVGAAPPTLPSEARAPENETKPYCFDDKPTVARQANRA